MSDATGLRIIFSNAATGLPLRCECDYISPANWTRTPTSSLTNPDCTAWSNDPNILCYHFQSCKAGLLDNIKSDWKRVVAINIIFLIFLIIVYSVGCGAFRKN
ncbi:tetraspanin-8-like, partial [Olea europaea subsp. europaea]